MFEIGIQALGGMERFVKKGQSVLVKPNIGWDKKPEQGANTNPELIGKIVAMAYAAGAAKVVVFDHTCNQMKDCYSNSGIEKHVLANGGVLEPADDEKYYKKVAIPGGKILKEAKVHQRYLDSDVIINVPVLKNHSGAAMTCCLKNLMGVVWDRRFWHREGLHQCIADFPLLRRPQLSVVDAYRVMVQNGPRGISANDLALKRMQLLSTDGVLADSAAVRILGVEQERVKYLALAEQAGYGSTSLENKNIKRISCGV